MGRQNQIPEPYPNPASKSSEFGEDLEPNPPGTPNSESVDSKSAGHTDDSPNPHSEANPSSFACHSCAVHARRLHAALAARAFYKHLADFDRFLSALAKWG